MWTAWAQPLPSCLLQPAPRWRSDSRGGRLKPSSAKCGRCVTTPSFCPPRRIWTTWTRSWRPSGCRDNQRLATTSSRRGEAGLGSSPCSSMRTPETKCPCWKSASTCPAREARSLAWAHLRWSRLQARMLWWPPSKLSSTWQGRRHRCPLRHRHRCRRPHLHPHHRHRCPRPYGAGRGNTDRSPQRSPRSLYHSPFPRKRR